MAEQSKEAIGWLKKAREWCEGEVVCPHKFGICKHDNESCPIYCLDKALSLIQQPCETCRDTKKVFVPPKLGLPTKLGKYIPCPICQPSVGEPIIDAEAIQTATLEENKELRTLLDQKDKTITEQALKKGKTT